MKRSLSLSPVAKDTKKLRATPKHFDSSIVLSPSPLNCRKLVSWNVGSINACLKKGFLDYVKAEDADILLLQETKLNKDSTYVPLDTYPFQYQNHCSVKKGYSGVAVLSKIEPISVLYEIGDPELDKEGRYIVLEFEDYFLINAYVLNAGTKLERLEMKRAHMQDRLKTFVKSLTKPVILGGDMNVAYQEIDLSRPKTNHKTAGFTPGEREDFGALMDECGLVDTYRKVHPEAADKFSYYSYRFNCYAKALGWRIDYFLCSGSLAEKVVDADVRDDCYGASDHVPILLVLKNGENSDS